MNKKERINEHDRDFVVDEEKPIDIHDLLNRFLRRKNLFLYIAIPIFLGILIVQLRRPYNPIYRATFDIGVSKERPVEGFFSGYQETPTLQIGSVTQRVISSFLSVNLADKVVDSLNLYAYVENGGSDIKVEIKMKKEFDKVIGPLKLELTNDRFTIFDNGDKIKEGMLDEFVDFDLFELKVIPLTKSSKGKTYELTVYPRDKVALALRNSLSIEVLEADKVEKGAGSSDVPFSGEGVSDKLVSAKTIFPGMNLLGILRIDVHWGNPDDALKIAEVLSYQIVEENKKEKSLQFIQSRTFIDSQLTVYQAKLTNLEEGIRLFKEKKKIVDLKASTHALITQISQLESQKSQRQIEQKILKDLGAYLATNIEKVNEIPNFASALVSDPVLQNFYAQLLQTEAELKGRLKEYSKGHPKVLEIRAKLNGLKDQMREEIAKRIPTIGTEIQSIDNQIRSLQARLESVPDDEIQLARLERDKETAEKLYTFFAGKLEETRVQEAGVTSDLKIINPPIIHPYPVNSRGRLKALIMALFVSILSGGFAVVVAEYLDTTVKDPDMLTEKIGIPIFASIPDVDGAPLKSKKTKSGKASFIEQINRHRLDFLDRTKRIFKKEKRVKKFKILDGNIDSAEFEAFRKLSMNLEFAHPEKNYKVIYITSVGPTEGKTFVSANLGHVLGMANKKVVIIDTDFRKKRGNLTYITKSRNKKGLFDILKGEIKLQDTIIPFTTPLSEGKSSGSATNSQDALRPTPDVQNNARRSSLSAVDLLPTGKIPPNPFVFLESDKMQNLITELKSKYDYVLIDGVPLLLFADATYLANFVEGVLLTVKYGKIGFRELEYARDMLLSTKANVLGIVMNGVPKTKEGYYYYYHHYHYYHKYYSKYYKKD